MDGVRELVAKWRKEAEAYDEKEWIRRGYLRCADELEAALGCQKFG